MKKVLLVGVFDLFHIGHLNLLLKAKKKGDYLTVAIHNDIYKIKNIDFIHSLKDRIKIMKSINCVDNVISYTRIDLLIKKVDFDIFVYGPDQNHQYFQKAFQWCKKNNKKIIKIPKTPGISSTKIREILKSKKYINYHS